MSVDPSQRPWVLARSDISDPQARSLTSLHAEQRLHCIANQGEGWQVYVGRCEGCGHDTLQLDAETPARLSCERCGVITTLALALAQHQLVEVPTMVVDAELYVLLES